MAGRGDGTLQEVLEEELQVLELLLVEETWGLPWQRWWAGCTGPAPGGRCLPTDRSPDFVHTGPTSVCVLKFYFSNPSLQTCSISRLNTSERLLSLQVHTEDRALCTGNR